MAETTLVVTGLSIGLGFVSDHTLQGVPEESVFRIAENAHDFVDRLVVFGKNPETNLSERVNLLSERLHMRVDLPARADAPVLPVVEFVFQGLETAYRSFRADGLFEHAIQAQLTGPQ